MKSQIIHHESQTIEKLMKTGLTELKAKQQKNSYKMIAKKQRKQYSIKSIESIISVIDDKLNSNTDLKQKAYLLERKRVNLDKLVKLQNKPDSVICPVNGIDVSNYYACEDIYI